MSIPDAPVNPLDLPASWSAQFGLTRPDVLVYLQFYVEKHSDVRTIAEHTGLTDDDVAACIARLGARQLLLPAPDDHAAYRPVNPELALQRILVRKEAEVTAQQAQVEQMRIDLDSFRDYCRELRETRSHLSYEILDSRDETVARFNELHNNVAEELITLRTYKRNENSDEQCRDFASIIERGASVKLVVLEGHIGDRETARHLRALTEVGVDIRVTTAMASWLFVFDRRAVLIPNDPTDIHRGTIMMHTPSIVSLASSWADAVWNSARSLVDRPAVVQPNDLQPLERELLHVLAQGAKDDTAARHLGVSARTIRRMVSDLCERAGAESRFELGVRAKTLGWI